MTVKILNYVIINNINPLYFIINKINGYIESNGDKYLAIVSTAESEDTIKKYNKLYNKLRDLVRSITNNSDNYNEKYFKKFNSDVNLPLKKTLELHNMVTVARSVFHDGNK